LIFGYAQLSRADWITLNGSQLAPNIAEIFVLDDHVRVQLEVYVGDLEKFVELVPDELLLIYSLCFLIQNRLPTTTSAEPENDH
jgi:hypothetical protein